MIGLASAALWGGQAAPLPASEPLAIAVVVEPAVQPEVATARQLERARVLEKVRRHFNRFAKRTGLTHLELDALADVVVDEAERHSLEPALVLAVMHVESGFRNYAVSNKDAMGLMQILPSTGQWLAPQVGVEWRGPQTLFDPIANVRLGIAYLRQLWDRYDDLHAALAAYNWGPGRIDQRIARGAPLPAEYPRLVFTALASQTRRS
jgi:soluble lytic murein transglycosylase-like protein